MQFKKPHVEGRHTNFKEVAGGESRRFKHRVVQARNTKAISNGPIGYGMDLRLVSCHGQSIPEKANPTRKCFYAHFQGCGKSS